MKNLRIYQLVFAMLFLALTASAQTPSAKVNGRVTDSNGAVVPAASVKITNLGTNISQKAVSNESGDYSILYLNPGRHTLDAEFTGFRKFKLSEFTLEINQTQRLDIKLEVGETSETVTVTDEPPTLNTETGSRGEVTGKEEIKDLPLNGRNFSDLALLTGGVVVPGSGSDGSFSINGGRGDNTGFLLDGMNNTQRRNTNVVINPPIESIQEFKVLTSGFSAEYGRYAGGIVTAITKSGTNKFHGTLYDYVRNDMFDARGFFDPVKLKLRRNQFGSTISGPLYLPAFNEGGPKLYDGHNRTFFMFTWDSLREIRGASERALVPTPAMLAGDFRGATTATGQPLIIKDSLTGLPFLNNQIPVSRFDPVAVRLLRYYPTPNLSGGAFNYVSSGNSVNKFNSFGIKIDHTLTQKDRLTGSAFWKKTYSFDAVNTNRSTLPIFGPTNTPSQYLYYIKHLHTISAAMFLESSVNYSHSTNRELWADSPTKNWQAETGFIGGTTDPIAAGPPYIGLTGYLPIGPDYGLPKIWTFNNYQATSTLTWVKGSHSLKFGVDFLFLQYNSRHYDNTIGRLNFLGRFTGSPVADFLLGWVDNSRRQIGASGPLDRAFNFAGFIQDDFKVSRSLTLNLGLRYDFLPPATEKTGAMAEFVPALGKVVIGGTGSLTQAELDARLTSSGLASQVVKASDVGLPSTIVKAARKDFAPRFGFAWRAFGSDKTVIRGGYGIFYGTSSIYRLDNSTDNFPFGLTETYSRISTDPRRLTLSNAFPSTLRSVTGVTSSYGHSTTSPKTQYIQSWSLAIEREFGKGLVVELAYVGSKGTHLTRKYDLNQPGRTQATSTIRPFPFFGTIDIISDGANSNYHSGQLTVRRRFSKQLFVRGSYVWSKSIDDSSNTGGTIAFGFSGAQDSRNLSLERGRSDFDVRHVFAGSFIWSPSFSKNLLLRDWQVSGTSTISSGPPFTPRVANVTFANGEATRPDRIANGAVSNPTPERWFDRSAFVIVPTGSFRFGNSGRNILDGPGTLIVNGAISRRFRIRESKTLQLKMEAFNLFNHANFNLPENNVDLATVGTIKAAKNPRNVQVSFRFEF